MEKPGPILIIEDDLDDQEIITEVLQELKVENRIVMYTNTSDGYNFLKMTTEQTFVILCDINLPGMNGLEFKKTIDEDPELRKKSIPFIFLSTSADKQVVTFAYTELTIQGFFKKTTSMAEFKDSIDVIINYWKLCRHPNSD